MTIKEILEYYPNGTVLGIWASQATGRWLTGMYLGRFIVDHKRRTIVEAATGRTWSEVQQAFRQRYHYVPNIAKVAPISTW